jgi:hypothetical protein
MASADYATFANQWTRVKEAMGLNRGLMQLTIPEVQEAALVAIQELRTTSEYDKAEQPKQFGGDLKLLCDFLESFCGCVADVAPTLPKHGWLDEGMLVRTDKFPQTLSFFEALEKTALGSFLAPLGQWVKAVSAVRHATACRLATLGAEATAPFVVPANPDASHTNNVAVTEIAPGRDPRPRLFTEVRRWNRVFDFHCHLFYAMLGNRNPDEWVSLSSDADWRNPQLAAERFSAEAWDSQLDGGDLVSKLNNLITQPVLLASGLALLASGDGYATAAETKGRLERAKAQRPIFRDPQAAPNETLVWKANFVPKDADDLDALSIDRQDPTEANFTDQCFAAFKAGKLNPVLFSQAATAMRESSEHDMFNLRPIIERAELVAASIAIDALLKNGTSRNREWRKLFSHPLLNATPANRQAALRLLKPYSLEFWASFPIAQQREVPDPWLWYAEKVLPETARPRYE